MKKLMKIFACLLISVFVVPLFLSVNNQAKASTTQSVVVSKEDFFNEVDAIFTDFLKISNRLPGSENEKKAAEFIHLYLKDVDRISAKSTPHVVDGVQTFKFESDISGLYENSQNVIFEYKSKNTTNNKVIVACHYDSIAYKLNEETMLYEEVASESLNGSAGNVALLLAMAKFLPYDNINFNIEFVFFGAGEADNSGSNVYVQGISDEDKENILCMVNIDEIALGENVYFYVDEINNLFSNYVSEVSAKNKLNVSQVQTMHLNKVLLEYESELGLDYTHIALQSDNISFMKSGITSINIFAGDYETGVVIGKSEFAGKDILTYTEKDNLKYITENIGIDKVKNNLYEVFRYVGCVLTDADFVDTAIKSQNISNSFYSVFGNQNLVLYLTVFAFIVFVIIAMYIYYKLSIKAYHANVEVEFLSSVVKISEQIDQNGLDANVPKVVSQVLANDIKKDKIIKRKRKKDKE